MTLIQELWQFIVGVLSHWQAYTTGGIIILALGLYERSKDRTISWHLFKGGVIAFLLVAFFMTWRDEHLSLISTQQELQNEKAPTAPKLYGKIERVVIDKSPDGNGSQAFIYLTIRNTGGTTIAGDFLIKITSPGLDFKDRPAEFTKDYSALLEDKKTRETIYRQESMVMLAEKAIESGNRVRGWLRFIVPDLKPETIQRQNPQFTITFKDVWEHVYSVPYDMTQHPVNP